MLSDPAGVCTSSSRWSPGFCGRQRIVLSSRSQEQARLEHSEFGTAKHLALAPFQALPVALHRAMTPGPGAPGFDRVIVVAQPFGKPLSGHVGPRRRPSAPGRQLVRLAFAHEPCTGLGQGNGAGQLRVRGWPLGELGGLGIMQPRWPPPHQPGRSPGREVAG